MPPATRYDAQLTERYGSLAAFRARRAAPDPAVWGPVLDHVRITQTEQELEHTRARLWTLTAAGTRPDTTLAAQLGTALADMYELIDLRDESALSLELHLGLTTPAAEPADALDPHAHLTPAPGTTRAMAKAARPLPTRGIDIDARRHTADARSGRPDFDARVEALTGNLGRLRARPDQTQIDPALRELSSRHLAWADAETACLFYRTRINALADGRWYIDRPLADTLDDALTALDTHLTARDRHARALEHLLARMETDPEHAPGPTLAYPRAAPGTSGSRRAAAQAVSPAAHQLFPGTPAAVPTAASPSPVPAPTLHR